MPDPTDHSLLEARELNVVLMGDSGPVRVLDGMSLSLRAGEVVDVTGPSGAGKTTLLRALARLMPSGSGSLELDGQPAEHMPAEQWRSLVALLPQRPAIIPGDVASNLTLPWDLKIRRADAPPSPEVLRAAMDGIHLTDVSLKRDASRLSVGQQARVALLRVLLTAPRVLLLDEPDAALDSGSAEALAERLRVFASSGGGIIRSRHRASDGLATRRMRLESGHIREEVAT